MAENKRKPEPGETPERAVELDDAALDKASGARKPPASPGPIPIPYPNVG